MKGQAEFCIVNISMNLEAEAAELLLDLVPDRLCVSAGEPREKRDVLRSHLLYCFDYLCFKVERLIPERLNRLGSRHIQSVVSALLINI